MKRRPPRPMATSTISPHPIATEAHRRRTTASRRLVPTVTWSTPVTSSKAAVGQQRHGHDILLPVPHRFSCAAGAPVREPRRTRQPASQPASSAAGPVIVGWVPIELRAPTWQYRDEAGKRRGPAAGSVASLPEATSTPAIAAVAAASSEGNLPQSR
ncbi:hypothetical protein BS50DRAFT_589633 [Corynespora cassiicola Philippines]|uniref:Uncharacterized protein n=1 Tax=Corynespora cassiicola Philippines TaxID=1448308 RepID=A0A2T2NIE7_CORCC|nr:hypothetical protein BS50DRAFT_589633 [Corynespora cassiicola Philippines]